MIHDPIFHIALTPILDFYDVLSIFPHRTCLSRMATFTDVTSVSDGRSYYHI